MMVFIKTLALIGSWVFFYSLLKSKNKRFPAMKATVITLLFSVLIFRVTTNLYALVEKALFSVNKQGEVLLSASPLKIPPGEDVKYCNQFRDQDKKIIQKISERSDGKYCGEFWKFESDKNLMLPYKIINFNQVLYWASPSLKITGSRNSLEKSFNPENPDKK